MRSAGGNRALGSGTAGFINAIGEKDYVVSPVGEGASTVLNTSDVQRGEAYHLARR